MMDEVSGQLRNLVAKAKEMGDKFKNLFSGKGLTSMLGSGGGLFGMQLYNEKLGQEYHKLHNGFSISDLTKNANNAYEEIKEADEGTAKLTEFTKKSAGLIDTAMNLLNN